MAVVTAIRQSTTIDGNVELWKWPQMANGDTGSFAILGLHGDKSVHAVGTFGAGGTVTFRGSNVLPPVEATSGIIHDPTGANLTLTTTAGAGLKQVLESTYSVSPKVTAGDGATLLDVWLCIRR